jgi:endonuclease/exonuclease/phosphatase family metal-dependent hydrolase
MPPVNFSLKVLTVNIHKGFSVFNRRFILHELREAVREVGADVVFLQEVHGSQSRHALRMLDWPSAPHYEFLADAIWPTYAYGRNAVYPHGDHGNALLSKFPIARHRNHDVSLNGTERRGMLHCVLGVPGSPSELHTFCVHLGLQQRHRAAQLETLCEMVHSEVPPDAPVIIAGDFNDWKRRAHDVLEECAGMREIFVAAHGHAARTFPSRWPMLALDRIYVRNATAHSPVLLPRRPWSHLSDHIPLAAEISL